MTRLALLLLAFALSACGQEREGKARYEDCREIIRLHEPLSLKDQWIKLTSDFACQGVFCVAVETSTGLLGSQGTCTKAYIYFRPEKP